MKLNNPDGSYNELGLQKAIEKLAKELESSACKQRPAKEKRLKSLKIRLANYGTFAITE